MHIQRAWAGKGPTHPWVGTRCSLCSLLLCVCVCMACGIHPGLSCDSQSGTLRLPVGKEAVQKESWLAVEAWVSPHAPSSPSPAPTELCSQLKQQVSQALPHPVPPPGWAEQRPGTSLPGHEGPLLSRETLLWPAAWGSLFT